MRILVVGAGGTGGYFGGRLAQAGRDVTFLVRPGRAEQLRRDGLVIIDPDGTTRVDPPTVTAQHLRHPYDLVLLAVKAYALDAAVTDLTPAVGPDTLLLPVLNGMRHLEILDDRFGSERVLGGLCAIAAAVDPDGTVRRLNDLQQLIYGDRAEPGSSRMRAVHEQLAGAGFGATLSPDIVASMWQKWVFLSGLAATSCLMRGTVGQVQAAPGGREFTLAVLDEAAAVAAAADNPMPADELERARRMLTTPGSSFAASMLRDLEHGYPVEADHILGDLVARARTGGVATPLLAAAYVHLKVYETNRLGPR